MICPKCRRRLPDGMDYQFCPYCGSEITPEEEEIKDKEESMNENARTFQKGLRKASTFRLSDLWNRKDLGPVRAVLYLPTGIVCGAVIGSILGTIRGNAMLGFGLGMGIGAAIGCIAALSELLGKKKK